jgi:hypothetical protein
VNGESRKGIDRHCCFGQAKKKDRIFFVLGSMSIRIAVVDDEPDILKPGGVASEKGLLSRGLLYSDSRQRKTVMLIAALSPGSEKNDAPGPGKAFAGSVRDLRPGSSAGRT